MQVFITGATGYIGFAVSAALRRHGHRVRGLTRNEAKAGRLARHEIDPVIGDLADAKSYADVAAQCSVLIHTAFEYSAEGVAKDKVAIETLLEAGRQATSLIESSGVVSSTIWSPVSPYTQAPLVKMSVLRCAPRLPASSSVSIASLSLATPRAEYSKAVWMRTEQRAATSA